ncbi:hypothetical protein GUITHDRAFT_99652 [Guillardia theta CCMP2712]|uniref:Mediator of RNA polymerase II transcription subunit 10 n=1 Tax=Guillardia theta (strain CCMP2712) TaxID=905079 RepID=L1K344_GUITC|nr:hypothetical protein GUITHDRAFT_99652 [Guillardia theta CCMP2712]EKX55012.1 hypothetical protein GUITHDRAFT_99652 [Guillardia theta CCMP2712]|eukprot:XP_005841992.1 hypothetical protein GUITHDRAFT_99652 [Guillardia theta CCMP2712]
MASKKKVTQAELESELEDSIECLRQLGIVLENYGGPQHEANYFDRINELVDHLKKIHSMKDAVQETVPLSVIEDYLDKGLTPELYTKHRLKVAEAYNQQAKGRIDSLKLLHDHVRSEVKRRLGPSPEIKFSAAGGGGDAQAASKEAEGKQGGGNEEESKINEGAGSGEGHENAGEGRGRTDAAEEKGGGGGDQENTSQPMQEDVQQEAGTSGVDVKKEAEGGEAPVGGGAGAEPAAQVKVKAEPGTEEAMDVDPSGDQ